MVEDLRKYTNALSHAGYDEAAMELMKVAEDLRDRRKLPGKVDGVKIAISKTLLPPAEKTSEILTPELTEKVRAITGRLDDSYEIFNLVGPTAHTTLRVVERRTQRHKSEIVPPDGWKELLQGLKKTERVILASAINAPLRERLYDVGSIRRAEVQDLTSKKGIGLVTARFIKAVFEPLIPQ